MIVDGNLHMSFHHFRMRLPDIDAPLGAARLRIWRGELELVAESVIHQSGWHYITLAPAGDGNVAGHIRFTEDDGYNDRTVLTIQHCPRQFQEVKVSSGPIDIVIAGITKQDYLRLWAELLRVHQEGKLSLEEQAKVRRQCEEDSGI